MGGGTGLPVSPPSGGVSSVIPTYRNGIALDYFRREMGMNPWHFWQLADDTVTPETNMCRDLLTNYAWQATDRAGRSDVAEAIFSAEQKLHDHLGYWPSPRYVSDEKPWPRYNDVTVNRYPYSDATGRWVNVNLPDKHVQAIGVESLAVISAAAAVTYSDEDSDTLDERFTVSVPTAITDPRQIAVYFAAADQFTDEMREWRIEPVNVSIAGGTATITGRSWLLVKPVLYEGAGQNPPAIDPTGAGNFVTTVAVYRRATYTAGTTVDDAQAVLTWETKPFPLCCGTTVTATTGTDAAATAQAVARCGIRDSRRGIVTPAQAVYSAATGLWNAPSTCSCWREPDRVLVRYLAGWPVRANGEPDAELVRVVMRLAAAELGRPICACEFANKQIGYWQFDLARTAGDNDESYGLISGDALNNPFGTRRGQVEAWRYVQSKAVRTAVLA